MDLGLMCLFVCGHRQKPPQMIMMKMMMVFVANGCSTINLSVALVN